MKPETVLSRVSQARFTLVRRRIWHEAIGDPGVAALHWMIGGISVGMPRASAADTIPTVGVLVRFDF